MAARKKWIWAGALVVFLLVAGLIGLRIAVNPEVFKPRIEEMVRQATGLTLRMEGPIRLSYFPWLGIELDRASLGGLAGFEQDPFVRLARGVIKVRLAALLRGELEAAAIRLEGLDLTLITAPDGRANWQSLPVRQVKLENNEVVVRSETGQTAFHYLLEGFSLTGGSLTYEDRAAGNTIRVTDLKASSGRIASGQTSDVALSLTVRADKPELAATTALTGKLTVDPGNLVFTFDQAGLDLTVTGAGLPFRSLRGAGRANVAVRGQDGRVTVRDIALDATASGGMFPEKGEKARLGGTFDYDAAAGKLAVSDLVLSGLGLTATGRLDGTTGQDGTYTWQFATNAFNPKDLLASLGIDLPGLAAGALTSLETRGSLVYSPSALGLSLDSLRLDGQNIVFTASVSDFAKPAMRFALTADALSLDRYLAAGQAGAPGAKTGKPGATAGPAALPGTDARIDGTIAVGRLDVKGLTLSDLKATVRAADGRVAVDPVRCGLSGGSVSGGLSVALAKPAPQWRLETKVAGVGVKPVLVALTGKAPLSGNLSASANVTASGATPEALRASLAGPLAVRLDDAVVEGFSVSPALLASLKGLVGIVDLSPQSLVAAVGDLGQAMAASRQGSTAVSRASASVQWNAGQGVTRDILVLATPGKLTGAGNIDLAGERLKLDLVADVNGVGRVPFTVEGPLQSPSVAVDKAALAKQAVTSVPKAVGKTLEDVGKGVLDPVKGFFGK